jgi:hypothetical protein
MNKSARPIFFSAFELPKPVELAGGRLVHRHNVPTSQFDLDLFEPRLGLLEPMPIAGLEQKIIPTTQELDLRDDSGGELILGPAKSGDGSLVACEKQRENVGIQQDHVPSSVIGRPRCR